MTRLTRLTRRRTSLGWAALALVAAALLAGCGKKGLPHPPADEPVTTGRSYPKS